MENRRTALIVCVWSAAALMALSVQAGEPVIAPYPSDRYVSGTGHGDLTKGTVVCRRVAELSARADLARQIRVLVKEHMIDRTRERSGREIEQDIELIREETVQEYLLGVNIVEYRTDEAEKTCTATAVMSKDRIRPSSEPVTSEVPPTVIR